MSMQLSLGCVGMVVVLIGVSLSGKWENETFAYHGYSMAPSMHEKSAWIIKRF